MRQVRVRVATEDDQRDSALVPIRLGCNPMTHAQRQLVRSLGALALLLEAAGDYTYTTENVKRWVLGGGGKSGVNCELCEENADRGWVPDDDVFEGVFGDVDGPPAHPGCSCSLEYKEKRVRVYA